MQGNQLYELSKYADLHCMVQTIPMNGFRQFSAKWSEHLESQQHGQIYYCPTSFLSKKHVSGTRKPLLQLSSQVCNPQLILANTLTASNANHQRPNALGKVGLVTMSLPLRCPCRPLSAPVLASVNPGAVSHPEPFSCPPPRISGSAGISALA